MAADVKKGMTTTQFKISMILAQINALDELLETVTDAETRERIAENKKELRDALKKL